MAGAGKLLWGLYPGPPAVWVPLQVDVDGKVKVDMANIKLNDLGDVSVAAPGDDDLFYYDNATSLWKSRKLVDADIPAGIARDAEVIAAVLAEATARDAAIAAHAALTAAACKLYHPVGWNQQIPDATWTHVCLDAEVFDTEGEGDVAVVSGIADATVADKLHDTGKFTEAESYYLGKTVYNSSDHTYTTVTGKDSDDQLSLAANIMADTETYKIYWSAYTAQADGVYLIIATNTYSSGAAVDGKKYITAIYNNGVAIQTNRAHCSAANQLMESQAIALAELTAGDYLQMYTYQDTGGNAQNASQEQYVSLIIAKLI